MISGSVSDVPTDCSFESPLEKTGLFFHLAFFNRKASCAMGEFYSCILSGRIEMLNLDISYNTFKLLKSITLENNRDIRKMALIKVRQEA